MACGLPVVATPVGGTTEVVTSQEAGHIIANRTTEALIVGIQALLDRYPLRSAVRTYAEQFDWRPTSMGQIKLFRLILKQFKNVNPHA